MTFWWILPPLKTFSPGKKCREGFLDPNSASLASGGLVSARLASGGLVSARPASGGLVSARLASGGLVSARLHSGAPGLDKTGLFSPRLGSGGSGDVADGRQGLDALSSRAGDIDKAWWSRRQGLGTSTRPGGFDAKARAPRDLGGSRRYRATWREGTVWTTRGRSLDDVGDWTGSTGRRRHRHPPLPLPTRAPSRAFVL